MPYYIRRQRKRNRVIYLIVREADDKVVGKSDSLEKAKASIRARMAGERQWRKRAEDYGFRRR